MSNLFSSLLLTFAVAVSVAACSDDSASGLDSDRLASSLSEDEQDQLCAYENELAQEGGTCGGAGQAPPSDICQDSDRFTDDMGCGYTVAEVEQCFEDRLADPCAPSDPLSCQHIENCECLNPEACLG